jgi:UDP-glucose 4-epimerase
MSVLVTGGAGYVGSITAERLVHEGHEVVVLDNLATGYRKAVQPGIPFVQAECGSPEVVRQVLRDHRVTAVLHFAGDPVVGKSMRDPGAFFRTNVSQGVSLLDAMISSGCLSIVFSSTCAIFGEPVRTPMDEDHPTRPVNPYGESKLMFEHVLEWYHRCHGLRFIALRYFNAAGASKVLGEDHRPETHLLPNLCDVALGKRPRATLFGSDYPTADGTCIRDYVHVVDLAAAHVLALQKLDAYPAGRFNLGSGRGVSNLELLRAVERVSGATIPFDIMARRPGDPAVLVADSKRAQTDLGWNAIESRIDGIVESALAWRRRHPEGYRDSQAA